MPPAETANQDLAEPELTMFVEGSTFEIMEIISGSSFMYFHREL